MFASQRNFGLIPAARLEKPDLLFTDLRLDDGTSGLARGNGNGIPESGETIELTAFVKNQGVGNAVGVKLTSGGINPGITWEKDKAEIGTIPIGETVKAKLAFTIPRNFDAKEILSSLKVTDIRGVSEAAKQIAQPFSRQAPSIQYAHKVLSQGREVSSVINGEEYELEFAVRNDGQLAAQGVAVSLTTGPAVSIDRNRLEIGEIKAKSSLPAQRVRFSVPRTYTEGTVPVAIVVSQSEFGPTEGTISVPVTVKKPVLSYEARLLGKSGRNSIEKGEEAVLEVEVVNSDGLVKSQHPPE